jgi:hypothetical protein
MLRTLSLSKWSINPEPSTRAQAEVQTPSFGPRIVEGLILFLNYNMKTQKPMNQFKKTAIAVIGWIFIGLGILGLFLPILQGILFIMIGLTILSSRSRLVRRFLKHIEERYPHQHERMVIWREKVQNWFKKGRV